MNLLVFTFFAARFGAVPGSLQMTNEQITTLAQSMEQDIPGALEYLSQWALDEAEVDIFENVLNRVIPPPASARFRGELCMYLLSKDPTLEPEQVCARLQNVGIIMGIAEAQELVAAARALTRIPAWLYHIFRSAYDRNLAWRDIFPELSRNIDYWKRKGFIQNNDRRFKGGAKRWYTLYYLWTRFCMISQSAASFDTTTNEWVMSLETQQAVFSYTAISMKRDKEML